MTTKVVHVRLAPYDVYIGRPSVYGNPFIIGKDGTRKECIEKYRDWLYTQPELIADIKANLKGKTLACWCKPAACHGDVIRELCDIDDEFDYDAKA